jgi:hypothetical protein
VELFERELRRRTCASREVWKRKGVAAEAWLKFQTKGVLTFVFIADSQLRKENFYHSSESP